MSCDPSDSDGRQLLLSGAWNENTSIAVRGGQTVHFRVTNGNPPVGTQLQITSPDASGGGTVLIPIVPIPVDVPVFGLFADVPIAWHFDISFEGDAQLVLWCLYSDWVPTTPVVEQVDPSTGVTGTVVTVSGSGMGGVTDVRFGDAAAAITQLTDRQVVVTAPAGQGAVDITVTTPVGTSAVTAADQFTYPAGPIVTGIDPPQGAAGTQVTVTGTGLSGATDVTFGPQSVPPSDLTDTGFTVTAPDGEGIVDIIVTTPAGTSPSTAADQFTYPAGPAITGIDPSQGAAGTQVTVTGTGFSGATDVTFGPQSVLPSDLTDTGFTVTAPDGEGTVDITVTTPTGTSQNTAADQFSYTG